jgi:hypothetical protein
MAEQNNATAADDVSDLFSKAAGQQALVDSAPSDDNSKGEVINNPGKYLMRVVSIRGKEGKKNWPNFARGTDNDSIVLNVMFEQIDDHVLSPKGSKYFYRMTIAADPKATDEKKANTLKFMKPKMCALLNTQSVNLQELQTQCVDTYDAKGKIISGHRMNGAYMIDVEVRKDKPLNNRNELNLNCARISIAKAADVTQVFPDEATVDQTPVTEGVYEAGSVGAADAAGAQAAGGVADDLPF